MLTEPAVTDPDRSTAIPRRPGPARTRWGTVVLTTILAAGGLAVAAGVVTGHIPNPLSHGHGHAPAAVPPPVARVPTVKVVRPKRESSVAITAEQIAVVEPYYRADLRARASGVVRRVHRDIGDKVAKGEVLIEIDVPEAEQDVARAEAMVLQRRQELRVSEAKLKDAKAAVAVSAASIKQREADVQAETATRDLKKRKYARFQELAARGSVVGNVVEEEERDYLSSEAAVTSAAANVERARADYAESESKVEAALADIDLKAAQIVVAQKELDRARAVADYARVRSPFDGVVIRRAVDPGSFVQNATTGTSEALISVAKVDLVTVSAKFPDAFAPSVAVGTPAEVRIDDLAGVTIAAKVTRLAPSVQNSDRTMRVEVDLFNSDDADYRRLEKEIQVGGPDRPIKGVTGTMPVRAFPPSSANGPRLLPGMTGSMKLSLGGFGESFVLPSTAVYSRSGTSYILLVRDGRTHQLPVRVQMNDGHTVKLAVLAKRRDADGVTREVLTELTGQEDVVVARQLEVGDAAAVKLGPSEW